MAAPIAIGAIASQAGKGIGSIFSALGSLQAGRSAENAARGQAQLLDFNAAIARNNAKIAFTTSRENARLLKRESTFQIGELKDKYTRAGVALSGSPLAAISETVFENTLAVERVKLEGDIQQTSFINQANIAKFQAEAARESGRSAARAGRIGAIGSLLSGGAGAASSISK